MADTKYTTKWWIAEITAAEKWLDNGFRNTGDSIVREFKGKQRVEEGQRYNYNVFWANVGVLKAALYARRPKPQVTRIWADMDDNIARASANILQRCLAFDLLKNNSEMDAAIKLAVEDWLIPGAGAIWLRYEADTRTIDLPVGLRMDVVTDERVVTEHVYWKDLIWPEAQSKEDIWFIARKVYLRRSQWKKKFGSIPKEYDKNREDDLDGKKGGKKGKIQLYEVWCKRNKKIYWVCKELPDWIKSVDDPLGLTNFYPCPYPLLATHTTDEYMPRADYTMCRSQYRGLNELNTRINILERAVRAVGVYDKKNAELRQMLSTDSENQMIAVDNWAMLAERGGIRGSVDWFPLEQVVGVLEQLSAQKANKLNDLFELLGISDIMRGTTKERETLGAQQLKAQYSSVRLQYKQDQIATFVRDALLIKAEIITKHFQPEMIAKLSNAEFSPDRDLAQQAITELKEDNVAQYRIDINEEGLALPDYQQTQQQRTEFLITVGQFLSQAAPMVQGLPEALPYMIQMIRWVASSYRGAEEIQGILDAGINAAAQQAAQPPQPPQPDPTKLKVAEINAQARLQEAMQHRQISSDTKKIEIQGRLANTQLSKDLDLRNDLRTGL